MIPCPNVVTGAQSLGSRCNPPVLLGRRALDLDAIRREIWCMPYRTPHLEPTLTAGSVFWSGINFFLDHSMTSPVKKNPLPHIPPPPSFWVLIRPQWLSYFLPWPLSFIRPSILPSKWTIFPTVYRRPLSWGQLRSNKRHQRL